VERLQETNAISDKAKKPFKKTKNIKITISIELNYIEA
jgi:hypothetical protein